MLLATSLSTTSAKESASDRTDAGAWCQPDAPGDDPEASTEAELEAAAQAAFAVEDYARAVELAAQAHALTGAVRHLYAQAHAERFRGDCQAALALYARVLAAEDDGPFATLGRDGIRLCEQQMEAAAAETEPEPEPAPEPEPEPEPVRQPAPIHDPVATQSPRWIRDPGGGVLVGLGMTAVAIGAGLAVAADSATRAADNAGDETDYAEQRQRSRRLLVGGATSLAVGGLLVIGAVIRYSVVARRIRLRATGGRTHAMLGLTARF